MDLAKISTDDNPADMMTKLLSTNKFTLCVDLIGLESCLMLSPYGSFMWCVSLFDVFSSMVGWSVLEKVCVTLVNSSQGGDCWNMV